MAYYFELEQMVPTINELRSKKEPLTFHDEMELNRLEQDLESIRYDMKRSEEILYLLETGE